MKTPWHFLTLVLLAATAVVSNAATRTFAGNGTKGFSGDGGPATAAELNNPFGVVRGPDGAIWFCEYGGQRVRTISPDGKIRTVVGTGQTGYAGDGGPALAASLNLPHEIRFDRAGHLFIVDMMNHAVRRVDARTQVITTIAGTGKPGYSGDGGPAAQAQLNQPHSIQFDPAGDLFICDIRNHVIRKVDMQTGVISTFAGTGKPGDTPDGAPIAGTPLRGPRSLDFDRDGNLWLATREGNQVFRFDRRAGKIMHVAGTGQKGFTGDGGDPKRATLNGPKGIALDPVTNHVYLVDTENHAIRRINQQKNRMEFVVGNGRRADGPDGDPLQCALNRPHGIWIDPDGTVFIGDSENHRIRVVDSAR
jgi:DNA-binding beta-propeller fold protein YncE